MAVRRGLGHDHVFWSTDSVWYGSPQWQIEAFRRLEIPEDMQKKRFAPTGPGDGSVQNVMFGYNAARFYKLDLRAEIPPLREDGIARLKAAYLEDGGMPSNTAYGFIARRS
jgi:uncharacterized protein